MLCLTAVAGSTAAFRLTLKLEAVSPKVFPPTYEGGKYATESASSAARSCRASCSTACRVRPTAWNSPSRMRGWAARFNCRSCRPTSRQCENPGVPKVTSLQAPHRIVDAILRDSTLGDGKKPPKFRDSEIGKELDKLSAGYATPLLNVRPALPRLRHVGQHRTARRAGRQVRPRHRERDHRRQRGWRQEDQQPYRPAQHPRQRRRPVQDQGRLDA